VPLAGQGLHAPALKMLSTPKRFTAITCPHSDRRCEIFPQDAETMASERALLVVRRLRAPAFCGLKAHAIQKEQGFAALAWRVDPFGYEQAAIRF
jgi:hypothetical protein